MGGMERAPRARATIEARHVWVCGVCGGCQVLPHTCVCQACGVPGAWCVSGVWCVYACVCQACGLGVRRACGVIAAWFARVLASFVLTYACCCCN